MDIVRKDINNHISHILSNDHIPNQAFVNEFQTNYFSLKLLNMEIVETPINGFYVDAGGAFLLMYMEIRNNTNETINLYREDFFLKYDKEEQDHPEDYFDVPLQFENEFSLLPLQTIKGCFVFLISKNVKKIDFNYYEYYDDENFKEYHLRYRIV